MKQLFRNIWGIIPTNVGLFVWELVAVAIGKGATWLISQFTGQSKLQTCQDERAILL